MTTPLPQSITWSGMTHRGRIRKNNEDAFLALQFDRNETRYLGKVGQDSLAACDYIFAVSDGMGGAKAGEFASRIVVDRVTQQLPSSFRSRASGMSQGFTDILDRLFSDIHQDIQHLGNSYEECSGMGATLSLVWIEPEWAYFGHVGDSRIYYLPAGGGMKQLSEDHTHVGWLFREGKINEREARSHPARNMLQQVLGGNGNYLSPQFGSVGYEPGDRFVICSDGVVDGHWDRALQEMIRQPPKLWAHELPAPRLVRSAVENSGRDNATAVVVEIGE